jgi:hypothetical protein
VPENPDTPPPASGIQRFLASIGGAPRRFHSEMTPQDFGNFAGLGMLAVGSGCTEFVGFNVLGHALYGDTLSSPAITAVALPAAICITVVDVCIFYRFPLHRLGLKELSRAGLRSTAIGSLGSKIATGLRVCGCITTGAVVGFFLSLAAYSADISNQITADYLADNRGIADQAATVYDGLIKRATETVENEMAASRDLERQISSQQQSDAREIQKARRRNWAMPAANPQLAALEARRAGLSGQLEKHKGELDGLIASRNPNILKAIDTSPNHKPKPEGELGRIKAFVKILEQNPGLLIVVAGIELIALGLTLAPALAHSIYVPSSFAARMALEHLKTVTRMAREGAILMAAAQQQQDKPGDDAEPEAIGMPADPPPHSPAPATGAVPAREPAPEAPPTAPMIVPTEAPRRRRGRPRKTPADPAANGHDPSLPTLNN